MINWNKTVPELIVTHLETSKNFWIDLIGFKVLYERPLEYFVYIDLEGIQFMLEQFHPKQWITSDLSYPFGRGINFQLEVESIDPILKNLYKEGWPLYQDPKEQWYKGDQIEYGQKEFLVQDPDGYLLRFIEIIGEK